MNFKFQLLYHITEDLCRFGKLSVLEDSTEYCNVHIKMSHRGTSGHMKKRVGKTGKYLLVSGECEKMPLKSTKAVNSTAEQEIRDAYNCLPDEERHLDRDGLEIKLRDIQAAIDGVDIVETKNAGLFSHLMEMFKENAMNSLSGLAF